MASMRAPAARTTKDAGRNCSTTASPVTTVVLMNNPLIRSRNCAERVMRPVVCPAQRSGR
ncbi:hypothetical protein GCM10010977_05100 [Citricoccus zhacaiensis]|uniref:Uncharacterized protein n=1 Tax=Citricoccus zhacaiensis TaxID=489142 RepID=A0ABQ2LRW4_9MICC|nr:hypothetical protein GCM10010977_05100 [Citricoccus zhacaiensis]